MCLSYGCISFDLECRHRRSKEYSSWGYRLLLGIFGSMEGNLHTDG